MKGHWIPPSPKGFIDRIAAKLGYSKTIPSGLGTDLVDAVGTLNDQIVALQNGKINKISGYTNKSINNVFTTFNGVTIAGGSYAINEELRHVCILLSMHLPALTHDTKILELISSEPAPKYMSTYIGGFATDQTKVNGIVSHANQRYFDILLTQSTAMNFFIVTIEYFY